MEKGGGLTDTVFARSTFDGEFRTRANLDRAMESPRHERWTTLGVSQVVLRVFVRENDGIMIIFIGVRRMAREHGRGAGQRG
jgi:hypothetical protein